MFLGAWTTISAGILKFDKKRQKKVKGKNLSEISKCGAGNKIKDHL